MRGEGERGRRREREREKGRVREVRIKREGEREIIKREISRLICTYPSVCVL